MPLLVAAPDKFRGTATAHEVAEAIGRAASPLGWTVVAVPLSDGGEGLLEAFDAPGSRLETTSVTGPDGAAVGASWRVLGDTAVIEMARASGLVLAGGARGNDPLRATSRGTGELMVAASDAVGVGGTVVVGLGGSATTDGGLGALRAVEEAGGLHGVTLVGACDVRVGFVEAATLFAPQKGASAEQVSELEDRLRSLADSYCREFGIDVVAVPGAGAAGGLGGGLLALGGTLRSGYELVAEFHGLRRLLEQAQLVITGEGLLDRSSFSGKVVGGVVGDAASLGVDALVVAGRVSDDAGVAARDAGLRVVSLSRRFGERRAMEDTVACVESVVRDALGPIGLG